MTSQRRKGSGNSSDLFRSVYWYDLWHSIVGFLAGLFYNKIEGLMIYLAFVIYEILESEDELQTIRDLLMFFVGFGLGVHPLFRELLRGMI
jgi:hypothetical protein